jgi:RNA polymerase sigma factor (sigma-70 family)
MNNRIQALAEKFFTARSEKDFGNLYNALYKGICETANKVLKDEEAAKDVASEVFIKVYENTKYVFDPGKDFLSYLITSTHNEAISTLNKMRKTTTFIDYTIDEVVPTKIFTYSSAEEMATAQKNSLGLVATGSETSAIEMEKVLERKVKSRAKRFVPESELVFETKEDELENALDYHASKAGVTDSQPDEVFFLTYNSDSKIVEAVERVIDQISNNEKDRNLLRAIFIEGIGPTELKKMFKMNSRITITSRRRRALAKIVEAIKAVLNGEKLADGIDLKNEIAQISYKGTNIPKFIATFNGKQLNGECKKMRKNGIIHYSCGYMDNIKHGEYREYYENGTMKTFGFYTNGKKSGLWKRYDENGNITECADYATGKCELYFENGEIESIVEIMN